MGVRSATVTPQNATDLPPGPDLPAWQVAKHWIERPIAFWEECAAQYGETFTIQLGSLGTIVLFSHPEAVRQIFQLAPPTFECRQYNEHYKYVMGARSVMLTDGAEHSRKRKLLMPPLHRRLVEQHGEAIRGLAREVIAPWPTDQAFSPRAAMHLVALKTMLSIIFGSAEDELGREIESAFSREISQKPSALSAWARFSHLHPRFRKLIAEKIRWRRSASDPGGAAVFDALVDGRDEAGNSLDDVEIQDHIFTLLVAGVETTAAALCFALCFIHEEQEVLARLRRELAELGPDADARMIAELPYLTAVCQETLRMRPIGTTPFGRKLLAPVEIQGRRYHPGVTLVPCTYLVHHRGELYAEPSRFRPERFLERQYASHEYFPFGGGARTCVGATLSPLEMKLVLAEILTRCSLVPAHDGTVRPVIHGGLLAPSDAMKFILVGTSSNDASE